MKRIEPAVFFSFFFFWLKMLVSGKKKKEKKKRKKWSIDPKIQVKVDCFIRNFSFDKIY